MKSKNVTSSKKRIDVRLFSTRIIPSMMICFFILSQQSVFGQIIPIGETTRVSIPQAPKIEIQKDLYKAQTQTIKVEQKTFKGFDRTRVSTSKVEDGNVIPTFTSFFRSFFDFIISGLRLRF